MKTEYIVEYRYDNDPCEIWKFEFKSEDYTEAKTHFIDHVNSYVHTNCRMRKVDYIEESTEVALYELKSDF